MAGRTWNWRRRSLWTAHHEAYLELGARGQRIDQISRARCCRRCISECTAEAVSQPFVAFFRGHCLSRGCARFGARAELVGCTAQHSCGQGTGEFVSLVEQAIARLKNQQGGAAKIPASMPPKSVIASLVDHSSGTSSAKRLIIDVDAMRAGGYLPEKIKERQFADQYRRIKRPLIEQA